MVGFDVLVRLVLSLATYNSYPRLFDSFHSGEKKRFPRRYISPSDHRGSAGETQGLEWWGGAAIMGYCPVRRAGGLGLGL